MNKALKMCFNRSMSEKLQLINTGITRNVYFTKAPAPVAPGWLTVLWFVTENVFKGKPFTLLYWNCNKITSKKNLCTISMFKKYGICDSKLHNIVWNRQVSKDNWDIKKKRQVLQSFLPWGFVCLKSFICTWLHHFTIYQLPPMRHWLCHFFYRYNFFTRYSSRGM